VSKKMKMTMKMEHVGGAYGKPLAKRVDAKLQKSDLKRFGELMVKYVVEEARKSAGRSSSIPKTERFFKSFSYQIKGACTVQITSTWPWIDTLVKGAADGASAKVGKPFRMEWLTKEAGVHAVPMFDEQGRVVVRAAPLTKKDAWIHPGIARHTFIRRGVEKAKEEFAKSFCKEILESALGGRR
jgi:hypothetical protein